MSLQSLNRVARVSVDALKKYLAPLEISSELISAGDEDTLTIEYRVAEISLRDDSRKKYFIVFVFNKHKKNRLLLLNSVVIDEVINSLTSKGLLSESSIVILVGKEGSSGKNQMSCIFHTCHISKLVIIDYRNDSQMSDYMTTLLNDIDRVENRRKSLQDSARMDLTSLPTSDKKIRLKGETGEDWQKLVFANQLLQLPGLTEKIALAVANEYRRPIELMNALTRDPHSLKEFSYISQKGDIKNINVRVMAEIQKTFSFDANPNDLLR